MSMFSAPPRRRFAALAAAMTLTVLAASARADEATLPPMPKPLDEMATSKSAVPPGQSSMEAWGAAHRDCLEWTDGCQVCVGGDKPGCSTVATACVRGAPVCVRSMGSAPPPAPQPSPQSPPQPQTPPAKAP